MFRKLFKFMMNFYKHFKINQIFWQGNPNLCCFFIKVWHVNIRFEESFQLQCQAGDRIASYFSTSPIMLPVPASQMSIQASSLFTDPMIGEIIHTGLCLCSYMPLLFTNSILRHVYCVPCFTFCVRRIIIARIHSPSYISSAKWNRMCAQCTL